MEDRKPFVIGQKWQLLFACLRQDHWLSFRRRAVEPSLFQPISAAIIDSIHKTIFD